MSPILRTASTFEELSLIMDCMWEAFSDPYNPNLNLGFPVHFPTAERVAAAIKESKARTWKGHQEEKGSVWVYIVDEDDNVDGGEKVLAAANWLFHEVSPFKEKKDEEEGGVKEGGETGSSGDESKNEEKKDDEKKDEMYWWPEGEGREFAKLVFEQVFGLRAKRMTRPHVHISGMFTLPTHRGRGYGTLLMKYGMSKISEMNVEATVEASEEGLHLYEKFGFRTIDAITIDTTYKNGKPGYLWKKLSYEYRGNTTWWMWKPKPSDADVYTQGMELPWEKK